MSAVTDQPVTYSVGFNMPGYMPDNEPTKVQELETAKECLLEDITHYLEDLNLDFRFTDEQIKSFVKVMQSVENAPPQECHVWIGDLVFWIVQSGGH